MSFIDTEYRSTRMSLRAHLGAVVATAAVFTAIASTGVRLFKLELEPERERPVYYLAPPKDFVDTKSSVPEAPHTIEPLSLNEVGLETAPELNIRPIDVTIAADVSSEMTLNLEMGRAFRASAPSLSEFDDFTIYENQDVDERPSIRYAKKPSVPFALRGEEVEVLVFYYVTAKGRTESISVLSSSSENPVYGDAAVDAIGGWRFKPAKKNKEPVACWIQQQIVFSRGSTSPFSL